MRVLVACEYKQVVSRSSSTVGSASEQPFIVMEIDRTHQHVVLSGQCGGLIGAEGVEVVSLTGQGSLNMVDDRLRDRCNV